MARGTVGEGPANAARRTIEDTAPDIPRDQWDRPLILREGGTKGKGTAHTRASTLGGTLEDGYGLSMWRMRMAVLGVASRRDLILLAGAIDDPTTSEGKKALGDVADSALEAAETQAAARVGTALHAVTEKIDAGQAVPELFAEHRDALEAYRATMDRFVIHASETFVVCSEIDAAGTFDRLVSPKGRMRAPDGTIIGPGDRLIMDLKTSATADYFGVKFAVQLAVYANGRPYRHPGTYPGWPDGIAPRTDWALILHMPSTGSVAEWYWVSLDRGWDLAQLAIEVREWRKSKALVVPAEEPDMSVTEPVDRTLRAVPDAEGEPPAEPLSTEAAQGGGPHTPELAPITSEPSGADAFTPPDKIHTAIRGASSEAALEALWERFAAEWTEAHTAAAGERSTELAQARA